MHQHQQALLQLIKNKKIEKFTYRAIAKQIGVDGQPETVKYHLRELQRKNLIEMNMRENVLQVNTKGYQKKGSKIFYLPIIEKHNVADYLSNLIKS